MKKLKLLAVLVIGCLPFDCARAAEEGAYTYTVDNGNTIITAFTTTGKGTTPEPRLWHVDAAMPDDTGDGLSWATAKHTIQAAIDVAVDGDVVLVTNGVYNTGVGHSGYGYSRIGITNNITVRSVNGAADTVIQGGMLYGISGETRCAFMSAGRLEGFTLEDGRTLSDSGKNQGGGVYALSTNAVVADCVIRDCDASYGGGVSSAAVTNCTLHGNGATSQGGGAFGGIITDSLIHNNVAASSGGGTYNSTLLRCRIRGNTSHYGGGSSYGALLGCEVKGNVANSYGGGAFYAALTNCVLRSNLSAEESGGGSCRGTLVNCTLTLNRAKKGGCGALGGDLFNCIVYDNHTLEDGINNWSWDAGQFTSSTSDNPKFRLPDAEDYRLLPGSSCLDSGQTDANFSAVDFYGNARVQNDLIDRGALEGVGILLTGEDHLPRNLTASTNLTDGIALAWEPPAAGGAVKYRVVRQDADAIDKMVVSEWIEDTTFTDTFNVYGHIDVIYWVVAAFDEGLDAISGLSQPAVGRRLSEIRYVDPSRPDDTGDGASWATAKRTLQAGIGATPEGGLLLVTNGVYNTGIASETDGKSRIAIAGKITVRSVNGAAATIIRGSGIETFGSSSAIRCIYMTDGRLEGFTLEHGATRSTEPYDLPYSIHYGGGVMATTFLPVILDCVVRNNSADHYGGGVYKGTVANCVVSDNRADYGGGLYNSKARNCTLTRNKAKDGGGASQASLLNCLVRENTAFDTYAHGGGTCDGTAVNCILTRNAGGGAYRGKLVNCTIVDNGLLPFINQAGNGGVYGATVVNSILTGNRSAFGELDNAYVSTVTYTCSDSVISGTGNRCADPLFRRADAGDFRLLAGSPCLDAGTSNVNSEVTDYLGHARIQSGVIDIGAVEGVGALLTAENARPQALDATTDQVDGITLSWQPPTAGGAIRYCVYRAENPTGDKTPVSDWVDATTFTDTTRVYGHTNYTYWVAASFDEDHASVSDLSDPATGCRLSPIWYADAARADDSGDGTSWETACKTIQTAIGKAGDGDLVLVQGGVYDSGVGSVVFGNSRVGIMKPVRVKAVGQAVIRGAGIANYGSGDIRCVTMLDGRLEGFVLEQGCASSRGGAGVYAETWRPQVSACVIRDNKGYRGGGVHGTTLSGCTISGNATPDSYGAGGGAFGSRLEQCILNGNYAGSGGGGGAYQSTLENCRVANNWTSGESGGVDGCFSVNCTVTSNRAGGHGGGAGRGKLVNCTITGNISGDIGGAFSATLVNCILWNNWNAAGTLANFYQGTYFDCAISYSCSYPLANGTGNISAAPRFILAGAGEYRLQAGSPCLNAGLNSANELPADLMGTARIQNGIIDMGAFEGSAALRDDEGSRVQNVQATTNGADGITMTWEAPTGGGAVRYRVIRMEDNSGISEPVSDWITALTFTDTSVRYGHVGYTYWVVAAFDDEGLDISALSAPAVGSRVTTVWYVDASRPDDSGNGTSWATAFKGIQAAVTNAIAGDLVLVTNGVYDVGIGDTSIGNSRISVTTAITVRSVEGAAQTLIRGSGTNAYGTASAVRCVRMTAGRLEGFTLEGGATSSSSNDSGTGGGVYAASADAVVVDCIIRQCKANTGCGAMRGRFVACVFDDNAGGEGGGLAWGRAARCRFTGNVVTGGGGGAYNATLENCLLSGNAAYNGGGANGSTLFNCTVVDNISSSGGAANFGTLANCIVWNNRKPSGSLNNYYNAKFSYSCTTPLPSGTGNLASDPLFRNAATGDFRILAASPCVDAGDGTLLSDPFDLAGNPRIRNAGVDLGAYERIFDTTVATPAFDATDGSVFNTTLSLSLSCATEDATSITRSTARSRPPTAHSTVRRCS
ncbi:MAG: choice-of-anchor Q domain-containing protein [Kiritimatiellae bacterium]|nr:choice-of-anchor Q domain-containing protein [Kiritimatiellia bacterium]